MAGLPGRDRTGDPDDLLCRVCTSIAATVLHLTEVRSLLLIAIIFIVFLVGARLSIPNRTIIPYLYPLPAIALLLATLFSLETGMIFGLVISVLAAYGLPNTLDLMPYYLLSSLTGVFVLGQAHRFLGLLPRRDGDCPGRDRGDPGLPPALYPDGLDRDRNADGRSGVQRVCFSQHYSGAAIFPGPNPGADHAAATARDFAP
jgi:hypothetical protein